MEGVLETQKIKSAIESLIFMSQKAISLEDIKKIFRDLTASQIKEITTTLKEELRHESRGIRLIEIAGGFKMVTAPENAPYIREFHKIKHTEKLSGPSLETLAIIAYKQPVTRVDIESIRGVNVDGVVRSLLEKSLIRIVGRKEVIGRPFVYGTSRFFLDYFGLKSLDELPKIEEFAKQDIDLELKLATGEAEITPLTQEEENQFNLDQKQQTEEESNENLEPNKEDPPEN